MSLTRAQGFWKASVRPDGGLEIQDRLYGTLEEIETALPAFGDAHEFNELCYLVKKTDMMPMPGGATADDQIWSVDLMYGQDSPEYIFEVEQSPSERPIDFATASNAKTAFLANWKYLLAAKSNISSTPAFWATATNTVIAPPNNESYRWINSSSEVPKDSDGVPFQVLKDRTKPGLESFILGTTTLRATAWYAKYQDYEDAMKAWVAGAGTCQTPSKTFGLPSTPRKWLLMPEISGRRDGYYWCITVRFMYTPEGWDSDIYVSSDD